MALVTEPARTWNSLVQFTRSIERVLLATGLAPLPGHGFSRHLPVNRADATWKTISADDTLRYA
jgi:hypothetical protein